MLQKLILLVASFSLLVLEAGPVFSQTRPPQLPPPAVTRLPGIIQIAPILGRESTGWELRLDKPLRIGKKQYLVLPVDPNGYDLAAFAGIRVRATGLLELRRGAGGNFITLLRLTGLEPGP